jgi:hypothetical protein
MKASSSHNCLLINSTHNLALNHARKNNSTALHHNRASSSEGISAVRCSARQITTGQADLLLGTRTYPCRHAFSWILDHPLPRTGHRASSLHECPRCSADPKCLVCLGPFDAASAESCPGCEQFFTASLLPGHRAKLAALNVRVLDERAGDFLKARLEFERERFRERWGAWADLKSEGE